MSGLTRWLMGSIQHPPPPWLRKKLKVAKDRRDLSVVVNYFSYCTLVLDHTSWVWIIWQRHWSCICVVLCTSGLSHTRLMTPVFMGELWVRLASLKPASFDTWKEAGHSLSRASQSTVKHSETRLVALGHMTWLKDARVKSPRHHGCWHDLSWTISHNYLDSFRSSGSINSRILALNPSWKQLHSEHLYMLFIICAKILLC